ncbi:MAG: alpha/beta fold hydrolase [Candidatus Thiodiazotropha sp.]
MHVMVSIFLVFLFLSLSFPFVLHRVYRAPRIMETRTPDRVGLPFTQQYLSGTNSKRLYSWHIPASGSHATLIVAHGWGANIELMLPLAQPFHQAGLDVLMFDARNHGKSDDDSFSSLPRFAEDLETAIHWVKAKQPDHRIIVMGHSIGAAAAILAASRRKDVDLVIGLSGFAHPNLVMNRHLDRPWLPKFIRPMILNYIQWVIGFRFDEIAPMNRIHQVNCPVMLAHGTDDRVVPISDMHLIEANASPDQPVKIYPVAGARHDSVELFQQHSGKLIEFIQSHLVLRGRAVMLGSGSG